ncbi:protein kinase domain-containing protein [Pirellulaceae bacterium SH449]
MSERHEENAHSNLACPATMRLSQWLNNREELSPEEFEHIERCSRCQGILLTLTDDPSLSKLASFSHAKIRSEYCGEPELQRVQEQLNAILGASNSLAGALCKTDPVHDPSVETVDNHPNRLGLKEVIDGLPIDRFIVEKLLAVGGTGAVYKAYDKKLSREVAIKVLSRNSMRDRQRFLREAKILADLEHPNIVRVFDVGTLNVHEHSTQCDEPTSNSGETNAQPLYLVLEYMAGGSAGSLCTPDSQVISSSAKNASSAKNKGANDSFTELASLVAQAAEGLAFAHGRGMIHRDVKPGNLLLNADRNQIKVADFGLARFLDSEASLATKTGDIMGTPAFMSPEQIQDIGRITTQSDVYSLGASLYQMLTGVLPYQGTTASVLRQIVDSRPVAPRLILPSIPVDFETICLRAMEHEPRNRYRDMSEFAEDLRRFNNGQPIKAKPISPLSHAVRFMRRNKSLASLIAICSLLLMAITVGSVIAALILQSQQTRLIASEANERTAKESALRALRSSIAAADDLLLAVTTETEFLPQTTGSQQVTRKLLEKARDYYRDFLSTNNDNAGLKLQLAKAHAGLAEVASRIGEREELERETNAALKLMEEIPDVEISPLQRAILIADTRIVLANYLVESGEAKIAIPLFDVSLYDLLPYIGLEDSDTLKDEWLSTYATSLLGIANAYTWIGQRDKAMPMLEEAKDTYGALLARCGDKPSILRNAAACDITLATTALDMQHPEKGRRHLLDADELLAKIPEDDAISLRVREMRIRLLTNLALSERRLGNNSVAKAHYQSAMEQTKRLMELEPSVTSHQWNLVVASLNSGGPDMELGLHDELVLRWQETVPVLERLIASEPENQRYRQVQAMLQSNIAIILRDLGQLEAAIAPLRAATSILRFQSEALDFSPESYLPVALNHFELAQTLLKLERVEEAELELADCDKVVDKILERDHAFISAINQRLDNHLMRFEIEETKEEIDFDALQAISVLSVRLARDLVNDSPESIEFPPKLAIALLNHAEVLMEKHEFTQAHELVNESLSLMEQDQDVASDSTSHRNQVLERALKLKSEIQNRIP